MATRDHALSRFRTLANMRTPRPLRAFGLMVVFGLIAATFFMIYVPWVQTAYGAGQVIALNPQDRLQNVTALVPGRIEKWYVQDGQVVTIVQGSFGAGRDSVVQVSGLAPVPMKSLAESSPELPFIKGVTPEFIRHLAMRWGIGGLPLIEVNSVADMAGLSFGAAEVGVSAATLAVAPKATNSSAVLSLWAENKASALSSGWKSLGKATP